MRHLAALLLGLCAGFALGYLARGDAEKARVSRGAAIVAEPAPPGRRGAAEGSGDAARPPEPPTIPPDDAPPKPRGSLVIEPGGPPRGVVMLHELGLGGEPTLRPLDPAGPGPLVIPLRAGEYGVQWTDEGTQKSWRVRVEPGRETRLSLADPPNAADLSIPDGTGVLRLRLLAADGRPIPRRPVMVRSAYPDEEDSIRGAMTDSDGFARFQLLEGEYEAEAGPAKRRAVVREGRETIVTVPIDAIGGEVIVRRAEGGDVWFVLREIATDRACFCDAGGGFRFLPPGDYEVRVVSTMDTGDRLAGLVRVREGETVHFDWRPPPGGIRIEVRTRERPEDGMMQAFVSSSVPGRLPEDFGVNFEAPRATPETDFVSESVVRWLLPGDYTVSVEAPGFESASATVAVGSEVSILRFELAASGEGR